MPAEQLQERSPVPASGGTATEADPVFAGVVFDDDVRDFCPRHDLWAAFRFAVESAKGAFHPVRDMRAGVEEDPDADECGLVLDVTTDFPVDDLLRRYDQYTHIWVTNVSWDKRKWLSMCPHTLRDE